MQVKLLKPLLHQAKQHWTGTVLNLEDHLVERLESLGVVTREVNATPAQPATPTVPQAPASPKLPPADGVEEDKPAVEKGDGVEEGGSEDKDDNKAKVADDGIEAGGSEDKE